MNWFLFLLLSLATHRLATMLTKEAGPFKVFEHIRRLVKRKSSKASGMKDGIECPLCVSVWFGALIAVAAYLFLTSTIFQLIIMALALSDVSVILNQAFTKDI